MTGYNSNITGASQPFINDLKARVPKTINPQKTIDTGPRITRGPPSSRGDSLRPPSSFNADDPRRPNLTLKETAPKISIGNLTQKPDSKSYKSVSFKAKK